MKSEDFLVFIGVLKENIGQKSNKYFEYRNNDA